MPDAASNFGCRLLSLRECDTNTTHTHTHTHTHTGLCLALESVAAFLPAVMSASPFFAPSISRASMLAARAPHAALPRGSEAPRARGATSSRSYSPRTRRGASFLHMSGEPDGKQKVLIIGAGPAGLLAAHLLLKQAPGKFDVTVAEQRADPRESEQASLRSYSLGLGVRGRTSIKKAGDEVWDVVKRRGVECERFSLHLGKRVLQIRQESPVLITEPSVLINRADLCAALLDAFRTAPDTPTLKFETQCVQIHPEARTVCLQSTEGKQETKAYDVLIGADGVNSRVRESMLQASGGQIRFAQAALNGTLKTIHQPMPAALDPLSVHAMGGSIKVELGEGGEEGDAKKRAAERVGLFWVPERNRTTGEQSACALINWDPSTAPTSLLQAQSADEVQRILNEAFPTL